MNTARTPLFYMANLGSEFTRAISAYEKQDSASLNASVKRAEKIIQTIENFPELKGRVGELEILNNILKDLKQEKLELNTDHLKNYFLPFAIRLTSNA